MPDGDAVDRVCDEPTKVEEESEQSELLLLAAMVALKRRRLRFCGKEKRKRQEKMFRLRPELMRYYCCMKYQGYRKKGKLDDDRTASSHNNSILRDKMSNMVSRSIVVF